MQGYVDDVEFYNDTTTANRYCSTANTGDDSNQLM